VAVDCPYPTAYQDENTLSETFQQSVGTP
jgi:hypothetical protein